MTHHVRTPVRRNNAQYYILLMLISFAASVVLTRLFLALTGYPKIGSGEFHIAHVLWGGLLLFLATLVPLTLANAWSYTASALLSGTGVGLFIDEVGKFITTSNNYFYPLAAPIIYAFFLLSVLLYLRVRRPVPARPRDELYHVFDALGEVLDRDLDTEERAIIETRLRFIAGQRERPDLAELATSLLAFLNSEAPVRPPPVFWERRLTGLRRLEDRWIGRRLLKGALVVGLGSLGLLALAEVGGFLLDLAFPDLLHQIARDLAPESPVASSGGPGWFALRLALVGFTGALQLAGSAMLLRGRERPGAACGYLGLVLSLTAVNLVVFYFDQFATVTTALIQLVLLLGVLRYRGRYLTDPPAAQPGGHTLAAQSPNAH